MKSNVKLKQILDLIDYNRESQNEKIQICRPNGDSWDDVDEVLTSSALLLPIYEAEICEMGAIDKDTIRVSIDWDALNVFGWDKGVQE